MSHRSRPGDRCHGAREMCDSPGHRHEIRCRNRSRVQRHGFPHARACQSSVKTVGVHVDIVCPQVRHGASPIPEQHGEAVVTGRGHRPERPQARSLDALLDDHGRERILGPLAAPLLFGMDVEDANGFVVARATQDQVRFQRILFGCTTDAGRDTRRHQLLDADKLFTAPPTPCRALLRPGWVRTRPASRACTSNGSPISIWRCSAP